MNKLFSEIVQNMQSYYEELALFLPRFIIGLVFFLLSWWIGRRIKKIKRIFETSVEV